MSSPAIQVLLRVNENTDVLERLNPKFVEWQSKKYYQDTNALSKADNSYSPPGEYTFSNKGNLKIEDFQICE